MPVNPARAVGKVGKHLMPHQTNEFDGIDLIFHGNEAAVRPALKSIVTDLTPLNLSPTLLGQIELALAEALNNIVEHAYQGDVNGAIRLTGSCNNEQLEFAIADNGIPLPNFELPRAACASVDTSFEHLPEGGFGWFLIFELAQEIRYSRLGSTNRLTLGFAL